MLSPVSAASTFCFEIQHEVLQLHLGELPGLRHTIHDLCRSTLAVEAQH